MFVSSGSALFIYCRQKKKIKCFLVEEFKKEMFSSEL